MRLSIEQPPAVQQATAAELDGEVEMLDAAVSASRKAG
jgi:hypothetical protein|tara:strand:+ start:916 stop:1029 length:114 start_codon:yes stop_codon:yes gene_type:complete